MKTLARTVHSLNIQRLAVWALLVVAAGGERASAALTSVSYSGETKLYASNDSQLLGSSGTTYVAANQAAIQQTIMWQLYGQYGFKYERVDDTSSPGDRLWNNTSGLTLEASVKFAGNTQNFGYYDNDSNNSSGPLGGASSAFQSVFSVTGNGYYDLNQITVTYTGGGNATQIGPNTFLLTPGQTGSPLEFGLNSPLSSGIYFSSNQSSSLTGLTQQGVALNNPEDHMVTFKIYDSSGNFTGKYVIAWEDLPFSSADFDYNDLVLEVTLASVPEPAGLAIAGFCILGGLTYAGFQRRRTRVPAALVNPAPVA